MRHHRRFIDTSPNTRRLLRRILLIVLLCALVFVASMRHQRQHLLNQLGANLSKQAHQRAGDFASMLDNYRREVRFLSGLPPMRNYVGTYVPGHDGLINPRRRDIIEIFTSYVASHPEVTQLRLIYATQPGMELVRVDHFGGQIIVKSADELQPKGDHDYFQEGLRLKSGEVYVSSIRLNREHKQVQIPYAPTLHVVTPLWSLDGKLFGLLVLNLNANAVLANLHANLPAGTVLYLMNNQGDFLLHPNPAKAFGFELGKRYRWQDEFLPLAESETKDLLEYQSSQDLIFASRVRLNLDERDPQHFLEIVAAKSESNINAELRETRNALIWAILGGASAVGVFLYVYVRQRWRTSVEQARLAAIVASSSDAIIGKSLSGVVTDWNLGAEQMFGYTAQEAVGQRLLNLIVPKALQSEDSDILARIARGESVEHFTTLRQRKDGSLLNVSINVSPIRASNGEIVGAAKTIRDVTEQMAHEGHIRQLNESLEQQVVERTKQIQAYSALQRAILNAAGYAIISTDDKGVIQLFNPAAEAMLGYRAEEVVGVATPILIHDLSEVRARAAALTAELGREISPGFEAFVAKAVAGEVDTNEWTYIRKNGDRVPVLLSISALQGEAGGVLGYIGIAVDLTERKNHEKAIESREHFLKALINNIPCMVAFWDDELHCRYANAAYLEWFNKTAEQLDGIYIKDLLGEALFKKNEPYVRAALNGEPQRFERSVSRANGVIGHTLINYIPVNDDERGHGFYSLVFDITELKIGQFQLEELNKQLSVRTKEAEMASRAKSEFVANMSHEIRTPMNAVLGMLQLLEQTALDSRQLDYVSKAQSASRALLGILNDILDFSKMEAGKLVLDPHAFSLDALLRDLGVILAANVGSKDVEVIFDIDPHIPQRVVGDSMRLQQVLLNLAGNAIKFTERGEVILSVKQVEKTSERLTLYFSVSDTGIGISSEHCKRIFDGFSQAEASTARRYGGSGLGLAICQRLVRLMGGELGVASATGEGSTFYFTLALGVAPTEAVVPTQLPLPGLRALLVVNHVALRAVLAKMMMSFGWHVETVSNGDAALMQLSQWQSQAMKVDVVMLDWHLPGMDGWDTARQIRASYSAENTAFITLLRSQDWESLARRQEQMPDLLAGFLIKPITASMIYDVMLDAHADHAKTAHPAVHSIAKGKRLMGVRLLLVEDNHINQQVARELLSSEGAEVVVMGGGEAALKELASGKVTFDAVLMDIQMPDMDGYEATRAIRNELGMVSIPVIAMTANAMETDRQAAFAAGMNDHIGKPFELNRLVSVIQRHIGHGGREVVEKPAALPGGSAIDVNGALERMGGDTSLYATILREYLPSLSRDLSTLGVLWQEQKRDETRRLLHTLKGTAGTVGADKLSKLAAQAENILRNDGDEQQLPAFITALQREAAVVMDVAQAVLTKLQ